MTNEQSTQGRAPLSSEAAFVVHLTAGPPDGPDALQGRVEHVRSGQSARFGSTADLVSFMQRVLAKPVQDQAKETA